MSHVCSCYLYYSLILTCVLPQMLLKVAKVVKVLLAVFTDMHFLLGLLVSRQLLYIKVKRADVLLQGTFPCVGSTAVSADMRFF